MSDDAVPAPTKRPPIPVAQPVRKPLPLPGAAVFLREIDIIRAVRLPDKPGRATMAIWKLDPTFPKPWPGTGGRRFWPDVERWLNRIDAIGIIPGTDGGENWDAWRQRPKAHKARKAKESGRAGPDLPSPPVRMAPNVVATIGPRGKRLSK